MPWRSWREELVPPLLFTVVTRLTLFVAVWISLRAVPRLDRYPAQLFDSFLPDHPFVDGWARWDTAHYVAIASLGYGHPDSPSVDGGFGFLPGFPLLMRLLANLPSIADTAGAYALAGVVAANVLLFVAVAFFTLLSRESISRPATMSAVALLLLLPYSFFLSAGYSESLFLTLALGSLLLAGRQHWLAAGSVAGLASATRIAGLFLAPALVYGAWKNGVRGWRLFASGLLPASGFILWSLYVWWKHGDIRAYFRAQAEWGGWTEHVRFYAELLWNEPLTMLRGDPRHLIILLNLAMGVLFLAMLPAVWRRTPPTVAMFTVLIVIFHLCWTWVSLGRYLLPAVGVYMVAGELLARPRLAGWPRDVILASATILLAALAILFAHGFWVV
ncbi:MAG: mannosyltransferase family protein [Thermomicrobiales bacterium]